ncbi:hypothetical protein NE237_018483 [Protea cynaroides]|uniref:Uncharacterized protein n=1 Tax=Protea cynaroides TaxID=273540 RepID=A0A9Q0KA26_9MAGN|nr:hypothetical protein NE237_018483 [Protea cynaroides]
MVIVTECPSYLTISSIKPVCGSNLDNPNSTSPVFLFKFPFPTRISSSASKEKKIWKGKDRNMIIQILIHNSFQLLAHQWLNFVLTMSPMSVLRVGFSTIPLKRFPFFLERVLSVVPF